MKYELTLKIESPVHIGLGDSYIEMDFIIDEDKNLIKLIDYEKLLNVVKFDEKTFEEFLKLAKEGNVKNKIASVLGIRDIPYSKEIKFVGRIPKRSMKIMRHIQSMGRVYIPGSSIKGFIRTALLYSYLKRDPEFLGKEFETLRLQIYREKSEKRGRKIDMRKIARNLESKIFGSDPKNDVLRSLKVVDSSFTEKTAIYEVRIIGNPQAIPLYLECIPPGEILRCEVEIEEESVKTDGLIGQVKFDDVLEALENFTQDIINSEKSYKKYPKETLDFYRKLETNENLLRIGHSTGYYTKTIGLLLKELKDFEDFRKMLGLGKNPATGRIVTDFPKTRRLAFQNIPLGWISFEVKKI
jgi:CRISPR-associated protein Csm5